jgi:cytochrome b
LGEYRREKIWDGVTRSWHWSLVVLVSLGGYFGEFMTFSTVEWHFYCGYAVLGWLAFRFFWGLVGPQPVRLRGLFPSPKAALAYLKGVGKREPSGTPGHNPLAALSVLAILLLLLTQASIGLFISSDDFFASGPLAYLISDDLSSALSGWHKTFAKGLLALVSLHVSMILFYLIWKKENLARAMVTGWKWVKVDPDEPS